MTPFDIGMLAGIIWAAILIVWALADLTSGEPSPYLMLVSCIYEGFDYSWRGICVGAVWAFADGFISGFCVSWIAQWLFG